MTVVHWSHKARTRLREIHTRIAKDSPLSATQMVDRLTRRGERLVTEPRIDRRQDFRQVRAHTAVAISYVNRLCTNSATSGNPCDETMSVMPNPRVCA